MKNMPLKTMHYGCCWLTMWNSGNSITSSLNAIAHHHMILRNKQIWLLNITAINQRKTNVRGWHLSYLSFSIFDLTSSSIDRISDATLPAGNQFIQNLVTKITKIRSKPNIMVCENRSAVHESPIKITNENETSNWFLKNHDIYHLEYIK